MRKLLIVLGIFFTLLLVSVGGAYLLTSQSYTTGDNVAVINVHGIISSTGIGGIFETEAATPARIEEQIRKAEADPSVKAMVLDINSPGGTIVASEAIALAVRGAKKPTVAWLGETAASGGYYVASAADHIVADRGTLTGSIGVIFTFPKYEGMFEKLGIEMRVIKAGEYKDIGSPYRNMTAEEERILNELVQTSYDDFIATIARNRNLTQEYVRSIAEGHIYTGKKAVEIGLADQLGTRHDAIMLAGHISGIEGEPGIVTYGERGFFRDFVGVASTRFGYGFAKGIMSAGEYERLSY